MAATLKQNVRSCVFGLSMLGLALVLNCSGCASKPPERPKPEMDLLAGEKLPSAQPSSPSPKLESPVAIIPYYPPPDKMDLCGEPVPLQVQEVYERFDREFTLIVYNNSQVYLWLKRMERYFPWIEQRLRHYNLPEDLKYVAIVESDLQPNACSPKGAAGPWQFMPATGCSYGLEQAEHYDERFDFERATDCAFRYLNDLHKRYHNWALAIAVYNCGDKRIQEQMRTMGTTSYYEMKLPRETERYVIRILAIKAVLSNAARYGYNLPAGWGYPELKGDRATVTLSHPVLIQTVAAAAGTTFREFKRLNPIFRTDRIPAGTYEIKLPEGTGKTFQANFESARVKSGATDDSPSSPSAEERMRALEQLGQAAERQSAERQPAERQFDEDDSPTSSAPTTIARVPDAKPKNPEPAKAQPVKSQPAPPRAKSVSGSIHVVKKGETLSSIARTYKVDLKDLKKANKLKSDDVNFGQKIVIP